MTARSSSVPSSGRRCLNPVTECANSSWYVWTVAFPLLPGIWDSTNEQTFEITNLVTEEPVVEVLLTSRVMRPEHHVV